MTALPSLFLTHGSPTLAIDPCPAREFMRGLGATLERPRAILCISAHWETLEPAVSAVAQPETIHDFFGFPEELYRMRYPAPGAPAVARRVEALLTEAGLGCHSDPGRGLDHGAWAPLALIWPEADIPVTQISVQPPLGPAHHLALGQALAPLRDEGVLILASGSATHDLRSFGRHALTDAPVEYAAAFADWLDAAVAAGEADALAGYRDHAPEARRNHPTPEHFLPLLVAMGAASPAERKTWARGRRLHASYTYGVFYMGAYAFG